MSAGPVNTFNPSGGGSPLCPACSDLCPLCCAFSCNSLCCRGLAASVRSSLPAHRCGFQDGVLDGCDARVLRQQVLAVLDDQPFYAMESGDFDDFVHHVLCREQLGVVEGTIARVQGEVVMFSAGKAFVVKTFADEKLADEEKIESVDDVA